MKADRWIAMGVAGLFVTGPVWGNAVKNLDLRDMQGFADAPVVHVYSSSGEKWDKVDGNRSTHIRLGFDAECRFHGKNGKAYEGEFEVPGFELLGNVSPPKTGWPIQFADEVTADLRWTGGAPGFDPAKVCNAELDKRLATQPGTNRYELLAKGFSVDYAGAVTAVYRLTCWATGLGKTVWRKPNPAKVNVRVVCDPSAKAEAKIPAPEPKPEPKKAKLASAVKSVQLKLNTTDYRGKCPAPIKVDAAITLNYPAEIKYRYLGDHGHQSPVFTLKKKNKGGTWNLAPWLRNIKPLPAAGKLATPGMKHGADYQGWMKLRILSPVDMSSKTVHFKVSCHKAPPVAPGGLQMPGSRPQPKLPKLRTGGQVSQPAGGKKKPREIVIVGSKAKKDADKEKKGATVIRPLRPLAPGRAADEGR